MASPIFWTDPVQAQERLLHSYILHNTDPIYVDRIGSTAEGDITVEGIKYPDRSRVQIPMADPGFNKFRKLPPVGWVNAKTSRSAFYLSRRPRRIRQHGLNSDNVSCQHVGKGNHLSTGRIDYENLVADEGYILACKEDFPTLEDVLTHIKEESALAISPRYCVYRDDNGVRWLYRESDKVGLFSGVETLQLLTKFSYLREEITDAKELTIQTIQEF